MPLAFGDKRPCITWSVSANKFCKVFGYFNMMKVQDGAKYSKTRKTIWFPQKTITVQRHMYWKNVIHFDGASYVTLSTRAFAPIVLNLFDRKRHIFLKVQIGAC